MRVVLRARVHERAVGERRVLGAHARAVAEQRGLRRTGGRARPPTARAPAVCAAIAQARSCSRLQRSFSTTASGNASSVRLGDEATELAPTARGLGDASRLEHHQDRVGRDDSRRPRRESRPPCRRPATRRPCSPCRWRPRAARRPRRPCRRGLTEISTISHSSKSPGSSIFTSTRRSSTPSPARTAATTSSAPGARASASGTGRRDVDERRRDADGRRLQVGEALLGGERAQLRADRARRRGLLRGDEPARSRRTDARIVSVSSGSSVRGSMTSTEMPSSLEPLGRLERAVDEPPDGDDRHVGALATRVGDAERQDEVALDRHLAARRQQPERLDEQHRVVVADRRLQQALGVVRRWTA